MAPLTRSPKLGTPKLPRSPPRQERERTKMIREGRDLRRQKVHKELKDKTARNKAAKVHRSRIPWRSSQPLGLPKRENEDPTAEEKWKSNSTLGKVQRPQADGNTTSKISAWQPSDPRR
jgi:hypothetical protein